jgi:Asp/Glu/hydantoin racemase
MTSHGRLERQVVLIHAVAEAVRPSLAAFEQVWPEAQLTNVFDDGLLELLESQGGITPTVVERIRNLAARAVRSGGDGVLFTCSSFRAAIEQASCDHPIPILGPQQAIAEDAMEIGSTIGIVATLPSAATALIDEFRDRAETAGKSLTFVTETVTDAGHALQRADYDGFDRLIAESVELLAATVDVVCFAQFSIARADAYVRKQVSVPLLSGPIAAAARMMTLLDPTAADRRVATT